MNIVYGGSFNPPTKAHQEIISILFDSLKIDNVILLPVSNKFNKDGLIDDNHRYNMLSLLDKRVIVSDLELHKDFHGTYYSLKELSNKYDDIHYVIGADNLDNLNKWINFQNLIKEFKFIVVGRDNIDVINIIDTKYSEYKDRFIYIDASLDMCSTSYRETKDENILTKEVYEYIKENHLYEEWLEWKMDLSRLL